MPQQKKERIVFFYSDHQSKRRVTVCGVINNDSKTIKFGHSVCNPRDVFKKDFARKISEGRARKNPTVIETLDGELPSGKVFHAQAVKIAEILLQPYTKNKTNV